MTEKLTYEQFCEQCLTIAPDNIIAELEQLHGIDATAEIERVKRQEYKMYLSRNGWAE